jgi:biotin carboxylase
VLKPLGLSASRGVIRADSPAEFAAAFRRIRAILTEPEVARFRDPADQHVQVERFIPGREFALEGVVTHGRLQVLALFDKPDPLDGPYFEETIYVAPSREPVEVRERIVDTVGRAVEALGLCHGPVHAEVRVNGDGVWPLEVAGRPIGGLCARALRFTGAMPLEELLLRHAIGEDVSGARLEAAATGVMMVPIPGEGIYRGVDGVEEAARLADVEITAKEGQHFRPLPEGHSYLGFLFAEDASPDVVEARLRAAHACLRFHLAPVLPLVAARG